MKVLNVSDKNQAVVIHHNGLFITGKSLHVKKSALAAIIMCNVGAASASAAEINKFPEFETTTTVTSGQVQVISSGIQASGTLIEAKGTQRVLSGATAENTVVHGTQILFSGASAGTTIVNSGGTQSVASGASASQTLINQGGVQIVSAGGNASQTTVSNAGTQRVYSAASVTSTSLSGTQILFAGAQASATTIHSGGTQAVADTATATDTLINHGGVQTISAGGLASDTVINTGGTQRVYSGASAVNTVVDGLQNIFAGGNAASTTINSGGVQGIASGATAHSTLINSGGIQSITSGGLATETHTGSDGIQRIYSGGMAVNTTVDGMQILYEGGAATETVINSGGTQAVANQASATGTTVHSGGLQIVSAGGRVTDTIVNGEALQRVYGGASANNTTISGTQVIFSQGTATSAVVENGGMQAVAGESYGTQVNSGGTQTVSAGGLAVDSVINSGGLLNLHGGSMLNNTVIKGGAEVIVRRHGQVTIGSDLYHAGDLLLSDNGAAGNILAVNGKYQGDNGIMRFNAVLDSDISLTDKVVIDGDSTGVTKVSIINQSGRGAATREGIELITVTGNSEGEFVQDGRTIAGAYDYLLGRGKGEQNRNNWYLTSYTRPEMGSYSANILAANTLFNTRMSDRLSHAARDAETDQNLWLRQSGGYGTWKDGRGELETKNTQYVTQIGGDVISWQSGEDRISLGIMGGYGYNNSTTDSDPTGYQSKGSVRGYSAGLYSTWFTGDDNGGGWFVDAWLLYNWFDNTVTGKDQAKQSYDSKGFTTSAEAGYAFNMSQFFGLSGVDTQWFMQPQLQATWLGVKASESAESSGSTVYSKGNGSLQTRLGIRTDLRGAKSAESLFLPYAEINWSHTTKHFAASVSDNTEGDIGVRNTGEFRTGFNARVAGSLSLSGDISMQMGENSYKDTKASFGLSYNF